jgi:hypothetical protein
MESDSTQQLQKFIANNNLTTERGIILFDAIITFYQNGNSFPIFSEVQVITFPKEMVLYIFEFVKDIYHQSEIYSTRLYSFKYTDKNILEIRHNNHKDLLIFSITAIHKQENPAIN